MTRAAFALMAALALGACAQEDDPACSANYDMAPPAAEEGAPCVPVNRRCDGGDGAERVCWFDCEGPAIEVSGCAPSGYCFDLPEPGTQECLYRCPMCR